MADQINYNQLIQQTIARDEAARKKAEAARKAADAAKLQGARANRAKQLLSDGKQRLAGLQGFIDDYKSKMQMIANEISANGGKVQPSQMRDLQDLQRRYNQAVDEQNKVSDQLIGISSGTLTIDDNGRVITAPAVSDAAREIRPATGASTIEDYMMGRQAAPSATQPPTATTAPTAPPTPTGKRGVATGADKYTGTGKTGSLLKKNGKPFTGTYNGKEYEKGVIVQRDANGLNAGQRAALGTYGSQFLIDYFKQNSTYTIKDPYDPKKREISIFDYLVKAARNKEDAANVDAALKNTSWFKEENERHKASIYAFGRANGLKLSETRINDFRDRFLGGVSSLQEIKYDLGIEAIKIFGFDKVESTKNIADAIRGGLTLGEATADYAKIYTDTFGISSADFDPGDSKFLSFISSSGSSLYDFSQKLKRDWQYLSRPDVQVGINAYANSLSQTYRQYGLALNATAINKMATDLYLGDTSNEEINAGIMKIAADTYAPFKDRILNGEDPLSLASPYISSMSQILEVPQGMLDLEDPTIRSVMMGGAAGSAMPLWQFEQNMYKDNRWQYTANARQTMDSITLDTLSRFGLMG